MNSQKVDPEHTGTGTGILFLNQKFTHKKLNQKQPVFLTNKRDLNDVLSSGLTKKYTGSFESAKYDIKMLFYLYLQFFGGLFSWIRNRIFMDTDPDFPDRIRICWAIRIRTQEKKSDPDPDKRSRIGNTAYKSCKKSKL